MGRRGMGKKCCFEASGEETLKELVGMYRIAYECRGSLKDELKEFKKISLTDAIENASLAAMDGKKFAHQRRLTGASLKAAHEKLMRKEAEITKCVAFDEIFDIVGLVVRETKGVGELYHYDTALRIGWNLNLLPDKIYLHRGTKVGAKCFGVEVNGRRKLLVEAFPKELQRLDSHQIEDFLCVCKSWLSKFND